MIYKDRGHNIILASGSPRRSELLRQIGMEFTVCVSDTDEEVDITDPADLVEELSYRKAEAVYDDGHEGDIVIGADTVVYADGSILGKPADMKDCRLKLESLSGKSHDVYTGVTVLYKGASGEKRAISFHEDTKVHVAPLTDTEIEEYMSTGEPMDKAGAYGIQGGFAKFITGIEGDYNNVVGLPVARLYKVLKEQELI